MKDVNKVLLLGRLGTPPVRRETKKGLAVTRFSLATSRKVVEERDGAEPVEKEETQWHNVIVWGKHGDLCNQYLEKGQQVFLEGSMRTRKYTAKDGTAKYAFEVHADSVVFLGKSRKSLGLAPQSDAGANDAPVEELAVSA